MIPPIAPLAGLAFMRSVAEREGVALHLGQGYSVPPRLSGEGFGLLRRLRLVARAVLAFVCWPASVVGRAAMYHSARIREAEIERLRSEKCELRSRLDHAEVAIRILEDQKTRLLNERDAPKEEADREDEMEEGGGGGRKGPGGMGHDFQSSLAGGCHSEEQRMKMPSRMESTNIVVTVPRLLTWRLRLAAYIAIFNAHLVRLVAGADAVRVEESDAEIERLRALLFEAQERASAPTWSLCPDCGRLVRIDEHVGECRCGRIVGESDEEPVDPAEAFETVRVRAECFARTIRALEDRVTLLQNELDSPRRHGDTEKPEGPGGSQAPGPAPSAPQCLSGEVCTACGAAAGFVIWRSSGQEDLSLRTCCNCGASFGDPYMVARATSDAAKKEGGA